MKPFTKKELEDSLQDYSKRFVEPLARSLASKARRRRSSGLPPLAMRYDPQQNNWIIEQGDGTQVARTTISYTQVIIDFHTPGSTISDCIRALLASPGATMPV